MPDSYSVSADIRYRVIDDEAVVVRQREGDVLVLNQVAARVLKFIGEGLSVGEIGDRVAREYEAPEANIRQDVGAFLVELEELNVIERVSAPADES